MATKTERRINSIDDFLGLFKGVKRMGDGRYIAQCPGHNDHAPSLSVTEAEGKILLFCHAGCQTRDILRKANLTFADLYLDGSRVPSDLYQYRNKDGSWCYDKQKFILPDGKKEFIPRRLTPGGELVYDLKGVERLPYNWTEIESAKNKNEVILLVEGERDAETARILGLAGTTFGGASDWKDECKRFFTGAKVIQIPDNDQAGVGLAQRVTKSLTEAATSLKVVILPPDSKDLTDWVSKGRSRADLDKLIEGAPELVRRNDWTSYSISHADLLKKELAPLENLVDDLITTPSLVVLASRKKLGKTWLCLQLVQSVAAGAPFLGLSTKQTSCLYLALEDGERRLKERLLKQHSTSNLPITYITKLPPLNTPEGLDMLTDMIQSKRPGLVIIDSLAAAKDRKAKENEADTMGDLCNGLHGLALASNTVILIVAHHGKASYNDPGFDVRGSSALPGATDTNLGLYKNGDGSFDLKSESRDMAEVDLRISFDRETTWAWQCSGDARDVRRAEAENRIIDAIKMLDEADALTIANNLLLN